MIAAITIIFTLLFLFVGAVTLILVVLYSRNAQSWKWNARTHQFEEEIRE